MAATARATRLTAFFLVAVVLAQLCIATQATAAAADAMTITQAAAPRKLLEGGKKSGNKQNGVKAGLNIAGNVLKGVSDALGGSGSAKGQKASGITGAIGNAFKNAANGL